MSNLRAKQNHIEIMSDEQRMAAYSLDGLTLQWSDQKSNHVRDKVFASLGLTYHPFQWKNESVSVNYNKTIEGVYRDFLSTLRFTRFGCDATEHFCVIFDGILGLKESDEIAIYAYEKAMPGFEDKKTWDSNHGRGNDGSTT